MPPPLLIPKWQKAICEEARTWIGTPFYPRARQKGGAVDCVNLLIALYQQFGLLRCFHPPFYQIADGKHLRQSLLETAIESTGEFQDLGQDFSDPRQRQTGDLLCFQGGRVTHHAGFLTEGTRFIHATETNGVIESDLLDATMRHRLRRVFRPGWPISLTAP